MKKYLWLISCLILSLALHAEQHAKEDNKISALPYYGSAEFTPHWFSENSPELINFHQVSDFKLINQQGEYITQDKVKNKTYVASFFFTSCPGICPKMRSQLSKVQDKFMENNDVMIISHSIQPSNDTVDVLQAYAQENDINAGKWQLLTGDQDEIYALARNAYFANEDLGEFVSQQDFLHTENLVLVDGNRHIRGIYNGLNNTSVELLLKDIRLLLSERKLQH
ncbi:SCO family protein [Paraglaciecola hydrolytica]|uniref:Electron transporter n=1 Tax=Paraglaciecola hydrolytica TaxID=1799789 RepID=A0A148KLE0_9ALTE|nr:SCO family protein [Paraglaciecola hydrolytica]KXI27107.1 electron transporter [Paraglaciecola hydrolytica]